MIKNLPKSCKIVVIVVVGTSCLYQLANFSKLLKMIIASDLEYVKNFDSN